jgi:uncharacterized membrane protein YedE/YeeE
MPPTLEPLLGELALPLLGGALLGLSAAFLMLTNGRIAGISGILGGALNLRDDDYDWRWTFLGGLLVGGVVLHVVSGPAVFANVLDRPLVVTAIAGLLVGFGSRLGSGCTAGHGICGLARLSPRSFASVVTFVLTGAVVTFVVRHVLGAWS